MITKNTKVTKQNTKKTKIKIQSEIKNINQEVELENRPQLNFKPKKSNFKLNLDFNSKKVKCSFCKTFFSRIGNYKKHLTTKHPDRANAEIEKVKDLKPFKCFNCSKGFSGYDYLLDHQKECGAELDIAKSILQNLKITIDEKNELLSIINNLKPIEKQKVGHESLIPYIVYDIEVPKDKIIFFTEKFKNGIFLNKIKQMDLINIHFNEVKKIFKNEFYQDLIIADKIIYLTEKHLKFCKDGKDENIEYNIKDLYDLFTKINFITKK